MEIEQKNQSNNNFEDVMDLFEIDHVYENRPIKRTFHKPNLEVFAFSIYFSKFIQ